MKSFKKRQVIKAQQEPNSEEKSKQKQTLFGSLSCHHSNTRDNEEEEEKGDCYCLMCRIALQEFGGIKEEELERKEKREIELKQKSFQSTLFKIYNWKIKDPSFIYQNKENLISTYNSGCGYSLSLNCEILETIITFVEKFLESIEQRERGDLHPDQIPSMFFVPSHFANFFLLSSSSSLVGDGNDDEGKMVDEIKRYLKRYVKKYLLISQLGDQSIIKIQSLVRGHLTRSKTKIRFLTTICYNSDLGCYQNTDVREM